MRRELLLTLSRMRPKTWLNAAGSVTPDATPMPLVAEMGNSNEGGLVRLLMSARSSRFFDSEMRNLFRNVMSRLKNCGPVKKLRGVLPCSPGAGVENMARCSGVKMKLVPAFCTTLPMLAVHPLQFAVESTTLLTVKAPE